MPEYHVMLVRQMSQVIYVRADSVREAVQKAVDRNDLSANVSNTFDDCGEVEVYAVTDIESGEGVWTAREFGDSSWEDR
jgi:hypothetical protein